MGFRGIGSTGIKSEIGCPDRNPYLLCQRVVLLGRLIQFCLLGIIQINGLANLAGGLGGIFVKTEQVDVVNTTETVRIRTLLHDLWPHAGVLLGLFPNDAVRQREGEQRVNRRNLPIAQRILARGTCHQQGKQRHACPHHHSMPIYPFHF